MRCDGPLCPSCRKPCVLIQGVWMCLNYQCETMMIQPREDAGEGAELGPTWQN